MNQHTIPITIVGGGVVGLTLAALLGDANIPVLLIEQQKISSQFEPHTFDTRVSAITRASQHVFNYLQIWDVMTSARACPYRTIEVWDSSGVGWIEFHSHMIGEPDLGHIVEHNVLLQALYARVKATASVKHYSGVALKQWQHEDDHVVLTLSNDEVWYSQVCVGADGANSMLRAQAGFAMTEWAYEQTAIIANLRTEQPHVNVARQCFIQHDNLAGTLAFLPLAEPHSVSIVWAMSSTFAEYLQQLEPAEFEKAVAKYFEYRLGSVQLMSARHAFPLRMRHVHEYVKPRLALIGDAAHTIHPLAGQGLNLGILDAACLAETWVQAVARKGGVKQFDLGHVDLLRRYHRQRVGANVTMITAMEGFKRLFGTPRAPWRLLRNRGLNGVDHLPLLKKFFIKQALGVTGDLPRYCQPAIITSIF